MSQPITVRTAHRLMKVLGHGARPHATQTALDMRAMGDSEQERLWLDIADVIHEMQPPAESDAALKQIWT